MSEALKSLLQLVRGHPGFPELISAVEKPRLPRFRPSQAHEVEKARATWIFESGRRDQHDRWLHVLTGEIPHDGDEEPGR